MKKFMKTCHKCNEKLIIARLMKNGVVLNGLKCPKCGEEYFTSTEIMKSGLTES